jgi:hypothetical protein
MQETTGNSTFNAIITVVVVVVLILMISMRASEIKTDGADLRQGSTHAAVK